MGTFRQQIVLFGDSLTQYSIHADSNGWGASLAQHYSRKADVIFRGFSGYNTRWALCLLDKIFPAPSSNPPLLVTVFLGANDAVVPKSSGGPMSVPLEEYRENLHQIVTHLKNLSDSVNIVLITPPPVSGERFLVTQRETFGDRSDVKSRSNALVKLYAEECVKVAKETGLPVLNIWSSFQEIPDWDEKLLSDGLHLSAEGNAKLFEELVKILDEPGLYHTTLKADDLPLDSPDFLELMNENNPETTLKTLAITKERK